MLQSLGMITRLAFAFLALFIASPLVQADEVEKKTATAYRHVVLFQFKEDASPEKVAEIEKAFAELADKIDTITDIEWGKNVSPEGLNDGLTHCFVVSFKDKAGLEKYLPHPAHKDFVALLKPALEKVVVVDFVAKP